MTTRSFTPFRTLIAAVLVAALLPTPSSAQQIWHHSFGSSNVRTFYDVAWCNSSQVVVADGRSPQYLFNGWGHVMMIDTDADIIADISLAPESWEEDYTNSFGVVVRPDGYVVVSGLIVTPAPYEYRYGKLWCFQPDGDQAWSRRFDGEQNIVFNPIVAIDQNPNGYILLGDNLITDSNSLLYTQLNGVYTWNPPASFDDSNGQSVLALPDEQFAFCGGPPAHVTVVDSDGETVWIQMFAGHMMIYELCRANDGHVIAAAESAVHKLDIANGIPVWSRQIADVRSVAALPSGGYIFCTSGADFVILDEDGVIVDTEPYDGIDELEITGIDVNTDGAVVVSGIGDGDRVLLFRGSTPRPTVTLTPVNNTIPIPPSGGLIVYHATLQNPLPQPVSGDAWTSITTPGGQNLPLQVFHPTMPADQVRQFESLNFLVPPSAPAGVYWFKAALGDYPNVIVSADSFQFSKTAWPGSDATQP